MTINDDAGFGGVPDMEVKEEEIDVVELHRIRVSNGEGKLVLRAKSGRLEVEKKFPITHLYVPDNDIVPGDRGDLTVGNIYWVVGFSDRIPGTYGYEYMYCGPLVYEGHAAMFHRFVFSGPPLNRSRTAYF